MIKRFIRKSLGAMFVLVFFLFAYNHVHTEIAKDNFVPMLWLFLVLIILVIYRVLQRIFRISKR